MPQECNVAPSQFRALRRAHLLQAEMREIELLQFVLVFWHQPCRSAIWRPEASLAEDD
jgi:hypothetical protein